MDTSSQANVPQPPKQSAYTQPSNPVSQDPLEQRGQPQTQQLGATSQPPSSSSRATRRGYGDAPAAIHRTADSKPSSDDKLAKLEQDRQQKLQPEYKRGHIDLEYGIEQQPAEGDIAAAVENNTNSSQGYYNRVQPGAHAGPVGSSTPGYEQDMAAQMDRKRAEHDRVLAQKAEKSSGSEGDEAERRQLRERKLKQNEQLDVKGAVKASTGDPVV
ncbi:uncharacterized protein TRUGW13939_02368 [Talaromyces rugulosus]|uniref:Uncharacterized protein n=1 Tax=Talaromyces rugulosus TaxID=121627 RepID=A0A7H8QN16_TALRU|nr:uncharacterized protein TRUGW13939_02368 [Talaromyces rugulosus]QKX55276.1 hypothetical protein TRUGW13939_02368 [Talaromyces rugulosus]